MKELVEIQKKLVPEVLDLIQRRYFILRQVYLNEPIGRRALANLLGLSERTIRSEVEFLKNQELIDVQVSGMRINENGLEVLEKLKKLMDDIMGISQLEDTIREKLNIKKVIIVPGDSDEDKSVIKDIGKCTYKYLMGILKESVIIGVTGGNTMFEFAQCLPECKKEKNVLIVPARGGLGKEVEIQSNTIAATVAKKLCGNYRLLHVPDNVGKDILESLMSEPDINKTLEYIKNVDILIFGIGRAEEMAKRRKMEEDIIEYISSKGAVGEAFGHYFNRDGQTIYQTSTIGITVEDFKKIKDAIGIAGGTKKAEAIIAISKIKKDLVLITDQGAANKILELI
ncbi:central glycolytic genes regulator [Alkalithermobacter thermoalcaliphilus JW-YL-7 = DSM 7308]|uniref:Central glycolytic genes regulator n=1 Tax=Alkalithermobacter thermoalcaliphilus JW-YL-7 = DSM 7308 TaxID=1121328 RepID=A0A150FTA3_CLOPD|nr:transcriptional regulator, DeoR family [[Clostridium] paradoxum JW-YL-7 = DSM 7308]SHK40652.1 central glycolytic genes regulator [[Clostridium] paradoxum JW-YL-7 = DSM 7308]